MNNLGAFVSPVSAAGGRIGDVDMFRGFCMLLMVVVHCAPTLTPVQFAAIWSFDCVAEGFVFLSGFMIGYHYLRKFERDYLSTSLDLFKRALEFLFLNAALGVIIALYVHLFRGKALPESFISFIFNALTLQNQTYLTDILPMFVVFFLFAPLGIWLYLKRQTPFLLLISANLFAINQIWPWGISVKHAAAFPAASWQAFFVLGALLGVARREGRTIAAPAKSLRLIIFFFIIWALVFALPWIGLAFHFDVPSFLAPKKWPLNFGRLILLLPELMFFYYFFYRFAPAITKFKASWPLVQIGRHSLLAFCVHVPLMYIWWDLSPRFNPAERRFWLIIPMYVFTIALFALSLYLKPKIVSAYRSLWD